MEVMEGGDECSEQEALPALGLPSSPASSLVMAWYFEVTPSGNTTSSPEGHGMLSLPPHAQPPSQTSTERSSLLTGDFSLGTAFLPQSCPSSRSEKR